MESIKRIILGGLMLSLAFAINVRAEEETQTDSAGENIVKQQQEITASDIQVKYGDKNIRVEAETSGDGELSYSSDNVNVAEVDEEGSVIINGVGTAVITIHASETELYFEAEKSVTLIVDPLLTKPVIRSGKAVNGGVELTWDMVEGAEGYLVYRRTPGKSWQELETVRGKATVKLTDKSVKAGTIYAYSVRAFAGEDNDLGPQSDGKKVVYLTATGVNVSSASGYNFVSWNKSAGAKGYYVCRKKNNESTWSRVATVKSANTLFWKDTKMTSGDIYTYTVQAYYEDSVSLYAPAKKTVYVAAPKIKSWTKRSSTSMTLKWSADKNASGYQIQYSRSPIFSGVKTVTIKNNKSYTKTVTKLAKNKKYYARIRAFKTSGGRNYYSSWNVTSNVKATKTGSATLVKKKKKTFELRSQARQAVGQYDIVQGSCTDGKYGYYLLYNKKVEKCRIVKINLSSLKVMKISSPLAVAHGNDMTYNSHTKKLTVVHNTRNAKRLSTVSPSTLRVEKSTDVKVPAALAGASAADVKSIKGFTGLSYNSSKKQYIALTSQNYNLCVLNSNMELVRFIKPTKKYGYTYQGVDCTNDYILVAQSPKAGTKQKYNIITVYDWNGTYLTAIRVKKGYELESLYHVGNKYYGSFYTSYYKNYYKTKKKIVISHGKRRVKKVRVKYKRLMRSNYIYRLNLY